MMDRLLTTGLAIILLWARPVATDQDQGTGNKPAANAPKSHIVEIRQMAFIPDRISVRKRDRITFVNHDIVPHDITEKKKAWKSHPVEPGKSWTLTVTRSADYYCSIHPVMTGKIIVK